MKQNSQFMASEAEYTLIETQQAQARFAADDDDDDFLKGAVDHFDADLPDHLHDGSGLQCGDLEESGADLMGPAALAPGGWEEDGGAELGLGLGVDDDVHLGVGGGGPCEDAGDVMIGEQVHDEGADGAEGVALAGFELAGALLDAALDEPVEKFSPGKLLSTPESHRKGVTADGLFGGRLSAAGEQHGDQSQQQQQQQVADLTSGLHEEQPQQQAQQQLQELQSAELQQQQEQQQQPPPPALEPVPLPTQQQQHLPAQQQRQQQQEQEQRPVLPMLPPPAPLPQQQQQLQQQGPALLNGISSRESPFISGALTSGMQHNSAAPSSILPPPAAPAAAAGIGALASGVHHGSNTLSGPLGSIPSLRHQSSLTSCDQSSLNLVLQRSPLAGSLMPSLQGIVGHINLHKFNGLTILPFGFNAEQLQHIEPLLEWARVKMGAEVLVGEAATAAVASGGRGRKVHILMLEASVMGGGLDVLEKEMKLPIKDFLVKGAHVVVESGAGVGTLPSSGALGFMTACRQFGGAITKKNFESCSLYASGEWVCMRMYLACNVFLQDYNQRTRLQPKNESSNTQLC
jgi:hypothetical protein